MPTPEVVPTLEPEMTQPVPTPEVVPTLEPEMTQPMPTPEVVPTIQPEMTQPMPTPEVVPTIQPEMAQPVEPVNMNNGVVPPIDTNNGMVPPTPSYEPEKKKHSALPAILILLIVVAGVAFCIYKFLFNKPDKVVKGLINKAYDKLEAPLKKYDSNNDSVLISADLTINTNFEGAEDLNGMKFNITSGIDYKNVSDNTEANDSYKDTIDEINKIKNSDSKVILIDEFEKADTDIFNFFYELLEDGKFTDLNENEYDLNGYLIIFTTNLKEENYKEIIPAPLLSRFTMKALFEPVGYEIKNKYIIEKTKTLVEKYNNKYDKKINYADVIKQIDKNIINSTKNFRYLNRLIQKALISIIEDKK